MPRPRLPLLAFAFLFLQPAAWPQSAPTAAAASAPTAVPPLVPYSGIAFADDGKALAGDKVVTFLIYKEESGGEPLWAESQTVAVDSTGHYKVQLGAASPNGLPGDLFATGEARWLEIQIAGEAAQPRVLLASVPYALKAGDATTLGGLPASAYALAGARSTAVSSSQTAGPNANSTVTTPGGTTGYLPLFTGAATIADSQIFDNGTDVGIGTATPTATLDVVGTAIITGGLNAEGGANFGGSVNILATGNATASAGKTSQPLAFVASAYNSSSKAAAAQIFRLEAEPTGNDTASPSGTLNLLFGSTPAETGLSIGSNGVVKFAAGQTFPGTGPGTITGVTAGSDLLGGGTSGVVTLNLNTGATDSRYARLAAANAFTGNQTIAGSVSATSFSGSGAALTGVVAANSAELGGLAPSSYAELAANNTFSGVQDFASVGIGTATPRSPLEIQAAAREALGPVATLTNTLGGQGAESALDFNTIQPSTVGTYNPMARIVAQDADSYSDNLLFQSNNPTPSAPNSGLVTNMIITSTGLVGIGTTTPASRLQVNGTVTASSFVGNGSGLTNITATVNNATELGGFPASAFAQLGTTNTFSGTQGINGNLNVSGTIESGIVEANGIYGSDIVVYDAIYLGSASGAPFASGSAADSNVSLGFSGGGVGGGGNTSTGAGAFFSNTSGGGNTANGARSLAFNSTGSGNTATGADALYSNANGGYNTADGQWALSSNTSGALNTAVGTEALSENTTGEYNIAFGVFAGQTVDNSNTTGSYNTAIGSEAMFATGSISNATAVGALSIASESNTLILGCVAATNNCPASVNVGIGTTAPDNLLTVNGSADKPGGGSWGTYSDMRLKTVNGSFGGGLNQVMQLRPIRYRYKPDNALGIRDADEHIGVVAQEVQRVIPEAVSENSRGYLIVNNDPVIWSMVNAIQEQQKEIEAQRKLIREQSQMMRTLISQVRETRKTLRKVRARQTHPEPVLMAAK